MAKPKAKAAEFDTPEFVGESQCVLVAQSQENGEFLVQFPFNHAFLTRMREIEGAEFDKNPQINAWVVPYGKADELGEAVAFLRDEVGLNQEAFLSVKASAVEKGLSLMKAKGFSGDPKVHDFIEKGKDYTGEIVAANGRYAAQFNGLAKDNGTAFISIHQLSELRDAVFVGDDVRIKYDDKGRASVGDGRTNLEKLRSVPNGQESDGVTVTKDEDGFKIAFAFNPALSARIGKLEGAAFDREAKVWNVPAEMEEFVARAVNDMRREVVSEKGDRNKIEAAVARKLDSANVRDAFTKDGQETTGKILAINDRFVAQHTGREYVSLHRVGQLQDIPNVGDKVKIRYDKGRASVQPKPERSQGLER
ncbi:hypothetical protein ACIPLR_17790 [Herbaspirillum huttiense]|uniref:KfrB domain-containing protein n=1 Tax=Herbaspirillum huttiense TaxID=863372 RepID=UPI00381F9920